MAGRLVETFPPAVAIGGMHRSGASLAASLLAAAGIHLGEDLRPAATANPRGDFEDLEFFELHQRILAANGLSPEGYSCQQAIDVPAALRTQAIELVHRRRAAGRVWGWKDPRTVLFLDFWAELLPEARWLFVVRPSEDVVDSLFRRGDTVFILNPRHAVDVWVAYHRRILDFVHRHADRSAVMSLDRIVTDPAGVVAAVAKLLGRGLPTPESRDEPRPPARAQAPRRAGLVRTLGPEARDLHRRLLKLTGAQNEGASPDRDPSVAAIAEAGLAEWATGCRALAEQAVQAARAAEAVQVAERLERELATEQVLRVEATARSTALAADLARLRSAHAEESLGREAAEARCISLEQELAREAFARDTVTAHLEALTVEASTALTALRTEKAEKLAAAERELADIRRQLATAEAGRDRLKKLVADQETAIRRLEAAVADSQSVAERFRQETHSLGSERDDLAAQLEAERGIYETLRQDMTSRIEAAASGRGRARSAV